MNIENVSKLSDDQPHSADSPDFEPVKVPKAPHKTKTGHIACTDDDLVKILADLNFYWLTSSIMRG